MPRMRSLSCSIVLTDNNEFNGPLMLIPGSQKYFIPCVGRTPTRTRGNQASSSPLSSARDSQKESLAPTTANQSSVLPPESRARSAVSPYLRS